MRLARREKRRAIDGTIPLINVVFLLLMFFLFAGTIASDPAHKIEPPTTPAEDPADRPDLDILVIDATGAITLRGEMVDLATAARRLIAPGKDGRSAPIRVVADRRLPADRLTDAIAALTAAGAHNIMLITEARR